MEKVKTNIVTVMLSCTKNVLLVIACFYFVYLMCCVISGYSDVIADRISSFFTLLAPFFIPIKNFMVEHTVKLFMGWLIIAVWTSCVIFKLDKSGMEPPPFLMNFAFILVPIGCLISFITAFSFVDTLILVTLIVGLIAFFLLFLSMIIMIVIIGDKEVVDEPKKETEDIDLKAPEQLEMFNDKNDPV
jgi:hypothetical protein